MSEPEDASNVNKARYVYHKPEGYEPIYVSGVYGGITPRGELLAHFFIEYSDIPKQESFEISNNELVQESKEIVYKHEKEESEVVYRRDIRTGLIIPAHQIQSFITWMQDKLDLITIAQQTKLEEREEDASESA